MLSPGDQNIVANIRFDYKELVKDFSDEHIANIWRHFSQSDDYFSENKRESFLQWLRD